ncbi:MULTISPECIES: hypothetical protein [Corynebacterium]|uniref:hypothetical protein n=1 Tax=Corynebacterium TaxID=1716 RepID=UPI00124C68A8|nr:MULTISPECIES: hypothetical protein [Corynebacterium]
MTTVVCNFKHVDGGPAEGDAVLRVKTPRPGSGGMILPSCMTTGIVDGVATFEGVVPGEAEISVTPPTGRGCGAYASWSVMIPDAESITLRELVVGDAWSPPVLSDVQSQLAEVRRLLEEAKNLPAPEPEPEETAPSAEVAELRSELDTLREKVEYRGVWMAPVGYAVANAAAVGDTHKPLPEGTEAELVVILSRGILTMCMYVRSYPEGGFTRETIRHGEDYYDGDWWYERPEDEEITHVVFYADPDQIPHDLVDALESKYFAPDTTSPLGIGVHVNAELGHLGISVPVTLLPKYTFRCDIPHEDFGPEDWETIYG